MATDVMQSYKGGLGNNTITTYPLAVHTGQTDSGIHPPTPEPTGNHLQLNAREIQGDMERRHYY